MNVPSYDQEEDAARSSSSKPTGKLAAHGNKTLLLPQYSIIEQWHLLHSKLALFHFTPHVFASICFFFWKTHTELLL